MLCSTREDHVLSFKISFSIQITNDSQAVRWLTASRCPEGWHIRMQRANAPVSCNTVTCCVGRKSSMHTLWGGARFPSICYIESSPILANAQSCHSESGMWCKDSCGKGDTGSPKGYLKCVEATFVGYWRWRKKQAVKIGVKYCQVFSIVGKSWKICYRLLLCKSYVLRFCAPPFPTKVVPVFFRRSATTFTRCSPQKSKASSPRSAMPRRKGIAIDHLYPFMIIHCAVIRHSPRIIHINQEFNRICMIEC